MSNSYRKILQSSSIIGMASIINVLIRVVRMKAAAVLLGPAGVGLIGLFNNLTSVATAVSGMGVGNVGVRQIAEAAGKNDEQAIIEARSALFWLTCTLAFLGSLIFWLLRGVLADKVLHDPGLSDEVGWLALSIGLSIASASQTALLNGMRRVADMSRVSVYAGVISTLLGILALALWGKSAILAFILLSPLASFFLGHWYVSRLPRISVQRVQLRLLLPQFSALIKLGFAFMLSGFALLLGQLVVRSLIQSSLGLDATGYFQAAWAISMTYIGFVLAAMGMDYYPRLTAVINDHGKVNTMVNQQVEVSLFLASPVILAMMALAPWVITLLYSREFHPAVEVLRWQILGDILKIACWPLAFIILAAGDGKKYVWSESLGISVLVVLTFLLLPGFGLAGSGLAFLGMYLFILPMQRILAGKRTGFTWQAGVLRQMAALFTAGVCIIVLSKYSEMYAGVAGVALATAFAAYGFRRLAHMAEIDGPYAKLLHKVKSLFGRFSGRGEN